MEPCKHWRTATLAVCAVLAIAAGATFGLRQAAPEPAEVLRWRETARLGTADGDGPLAFGVIGDVLASTNGRIYALDVVKKRVVLVSAAGAAPEVFGREGHGPGEFADPVALAGDSLRLYVLDRANQRVEVLTANKAALVRIGAFPLGLPAEDLCVHEGRLFVLGEHRGRLIHELDPKQGSVIRSFAPDTTATDLLLRSYRSNGYLLCGPGDELAILPLLRPDIQRFSASTGALLGVATIPGYRPVRVRRLSNGSVQFHAKGGEHDYASSIVPLPDGNRLIQVGLLRRGATTRHEFESLRSFELSTRDHQVREIPGQLPRILTVRETTAVAAATDPFSAIQILDLALKPKGPHER